jgi:tight adherence protein C
MDPLHASDLLYGLVLALAFTGAVALVLGVRALIASRRDRLGERVQRSLGLAPATAGLTRERSPWEVMLEPLARMAKPGDERELGRLRSKLAQAGLRSERAVIGYLATKVLLAVAFAAAYFWINRVWPQGGTRAALVAIMATAAGFYLPSLWLVSRIQERQRQISKALPDALDMLVTCVEAGLGLEPALVRVTAELELAAPLLARELGQTELEIRAGMSRGEAFRRMADRTGVEELRNLSAIIIQTQIFGTSIARSLRVQADAMRVRRMQIAEERAAAASVKMTVPLVLCIAPALFAVLLGPAVVKFVRLLVPTLAGGGG